MDVCQTCLATATDTVEEKGQPVCAFQQLSNSEVLQATPDALIRISTEGRILGINAATEALLGLTAVDLLGLEFSSLLTDPHCSVVAAYIQNLLHQGEQRIAGLGWDVEARCHDGMKRPVHLSLLPCEVGKDRFFTAVLRDESDLRAAEARIASLEASLAELQRSTAAKSAELLQMADQANRLKDAAETSSQAKSEFLSNISHELRTPITAILGFAELIQDEPHSADVPSFAERIRDNGRQLLALVDDILDLARVESGQTQVVIEPFSPVSILKDVTDSFRPQITERGLSLDVFISPDIPTSIEADVGKFRQILWNLVSNATKFTSSGGVLVRMLIDPLPNPPQLRVDVIDTGIGIPADKLPALFQPFTQVDNSLSRSHGGTGLGLALCKRYCELLGGAIEVSSLPGCGTNINVWMAFQNPSNPLTPAPAQATPVASSGLGLEGRRILIVEDNPQNLYLLCRIVQKAGAQTCDAANGLLGVEAVRISQERLEPIDTILLDMQMPVMDGYTAAHEIRLLGYTGPIIAITADTTDRARVNSLAAGCDAYVCKPVHRRELVNLLQRLLLLKQHQAAVLDAPLMWE